MNALHVEYADTPASWCAYYDPEGMIGRGKDRERAIADLLEQTDEAWGKALDERDALRAERTDAITWTMLKANSDKWRDLAQKLTGVDANDHGWLRAELDSQWSKRIPYAEALEDACRKTEAFLDVALPPKAWAALLAVVRAALAKNPNLSGQQPVPEGDTPPSGSNTATPTPGPEGAGPTIVGGVFEPDPLPIRYDERGNPLPIPGLVEPPRRTVGEVAFAPGTYPPEEGWLIHYADTQMGDEVFTGPDAERAARARFDQARLSWTAWLFRAVAATVPIDPNNPQARPEGEAFKECYSCSSPTTCAKRGRCSNQPGEPPATGGSA